MDLGRSDRMFGYLKEIVKKADRMRAAERVRDFMIWQHNNALDCNTGEMTDEQMSNADLVETTFLRGAALAATGWFGLRDYDQALFLINILGMYKGLSYEQASRELMRTILDEELERRASYVGYLSMSQYLTNRRSNTFSNSLAELQKACGNY